MLLLKIEILSNVTLIYNKRENDIFNTFYFSFCICNFVPLGSEALLIYNIKEGFNIYALLLIATFGNVLGSILNYYLGLKGEEYLVDKKLVKQKYR